MFGWGVREVPKWTNRNWRNQSAASATRISSTRISSTRISYSRSEGGIKDASKRANVPTNEQLLGTDSTKTFLRRSIHRTTIFFSYIEVYTNRDIVVLFNKKTGTGEVNHWHWRLQDRKRSRDQGCEQEGACDDKRTIAWNGLRRHSFRHYGDIGTTQGTLFECYHMLPHTLFMHVLQYWGIHMHILSHAFWGIPAIYLPPKVYMLTLFPIAEIWANCIPK